MLVDCERVHAVGVPVVRSDGRRESIVSIRQSSERLTTDILCLALNRCINTNQKYQISTLISVLDSVLYNLCTH